MILPLEEMLQEFDRVTVVYANSNIHPKTEYEHRRDFAREFALKLGAEFVELAYEPTHWMQAIKNKDPRCKGCYEMRLGAVAQWAAEHGADTVSSVMTISPYQDNELINAVGKHVCEQFSIAYLPKVFVAYYPQSIERSKAEGMYRQKYCGCALSLAEYLEQQAAKKQRQAQRDALKETRRLEAQANREKKNLKKEYDRAHR